MIDFNRLNEFSRESGPDAASTCRIWTDPHISAQLLKEHLNPHTDAASRRPEAIEATLDWIEAEAIKGPSRILDLGCGPGLYAERLAKRGHGVTGLDFSAGSIEHARKSAREKGLDIEYRVGNYVQDDLGTDYDLAMMIYCDLGALSPVERATVLKKARACLKPGGAFVFDFIDEKILDAVQFGKDWTIAETGFWSARPHLVLEESKHLPEAKMVQRMAVLAEEGTGRMERFMIRDYYFSEAEMRGLLMEAEFSSVVYRRGLLPVPVWGAPDPIFAVARSS